MPQIADHLRKSDPDPSPYSTQHRLQVVTVRFSHYRGESCEWFTAAGTDN